MALLLAILLAGELPAPEQLPAPRFAETLPAPRFPAPALQRGPCSSACTCGCQSFGYCVCGTLQAAPTPTHHHPAPIIQTQPAPAWPHGGPVLQFTRPLAPAALPCPPGR